MGSPARSDRWNHPVANYLDNLLGRIEDDELRADLIREIRTLRNRKDFGLVYERHLPETVRLDTHPVKIGTTVQERSDTDGPRWRVVKIAKKKATVERRDGDEIVSEVVPVNDLVVVWEFGDAIYPGLTSLGRIERGGDDRPWNAVINAENYHALEMLRYAYEGKVDCIYIDPPYNSGASDWKYNNNYVDADDSYRHSKWLAFMERRLHLASKLLNKDDSVLIVTIDEKEYHRLGLLLEQLFPAARIQMVTSVINPSGSSRIGLFSRSDEYLYFVLIGKATITPSVDDMLNDASASPRFDVRWDSLRRRGNASRRSRIPSLFYPIFFESASGQFHHCGDMVPPGADPYHQSLSEQIVGLDAILPVTAGGAEMTWNLSQEGFRDRLSKGYVRYYRKPSGDYVIRYLQEGTIEAIESGRAVQTGVDEHGFPTWGFAEARRMTPMTTWHRASHSATDFGTPMLSALLPGRHFPYPKSLYAVEDALRFAIGEKPDALVVDFFAGSGTTGHAVMRLNQQDSGRRQFVLVTNNELSVEEEERLVGGSEEERQAHGIFEYITRPRVVAAVTGETSSGDPVDGEYRFGHQALISAGLPENVEFSRLDYLDRDEVSLGRAFEAVAPLLWLKAGGVGPRIEDRKSVV